MVTVHCRYHKVVTLPLAQHHTLSLPLSCGVERGRRVTALPPLFDILSWYGGM